MAKEIIGVPEKVDKAIILKTIEKQKEKIANMKEGGEELKLQERFLRRKSLVAGNKYDMPLGMIQKQIADIPKKIKFEEEYLGFLEEIKDEK